MKQAFSAAEAALARVNDNTQTESAIKHGFVC
jgi:hypothetical protein